jgi:hypothetical protein
MRRVTMAVTADQVAALRAYLTGDLDKYERLVDQLDADAAAAGYSALLAAAFFEAVDRRFAENGTAADVVKFVGDVRAKSQRLAEIDPTVAERLILHSLGEGSIGDLDNETVISNQFLLLGALIVDEQLDNAGLDQFLAEARTVAEEWTS